MPDKGKRLIAIATTLGRPNGHGFATYPFALPLDKSLAGLQLFVQAGVLDAAAVGGFELSQGLTLTLGN